MEDTLMEIVIREYSGTGAKELFDVLEKHTAGVEAVLRSVKGFVGYTLARSGDGGFSVTVCQDKAGVDESVQKARDWIAKNAEGVGAAAPQILEGTVLVHLE
jgi:restriction endonuclease Mrr